MTMGLIIAFEWFDDIAEVHILFMRGEVVFILEELIGEYIFRIILVFPTDHKPAGLYDHARLHVVPWKVFFKKVMEPP